MKLQPWEPDLATLITRIDQGEIDLQPDFQALLLLMFDFWLTDENNLESARERFEQFRTLALGAPEAIDPDQVEADAEVADE